ncbi:Pentatricopeptide repeat-containing protein [Turnera subulata]|uniref:Pentatricopeptide repeat-containing protein n=1 Tax=Turnera subulata TaxID=218843 RepID=A0A9Q0F7L7_9ROSI|nr:Pentatricopeptide repeat-containing protein [Turnera subulata]
MSKLTPLTSPMRVPAWVSTRRLLEEQLHDLHKCGNFNRVKQVHAQIIKQDLHTDLYVVPKLISALSTCKHIDLAVTVFKQVEDPNVQLYNTLIRACVHNSEVFLAFSVFFEMQRNWLFPDNFTYPFLLKACNGESWLPLVRMIHNHAEKCGFLGDLFVPNALIDSYCKCGALGVGYAARLFASMEDRDVVSWNSMIGGLVKGGELTRARQLFDEMPRRDVVSWNTMLDGYAKAGDMDEAFKFVAHVRLQMKSTGIQKPSGASAIELDDELHEFTVFDKSHPKSDGIYQMIERLREDIQEVCCVP